MLVSHISPFVSHTSAHLPHTQDVRSLRESLEPQLLDITPEQFTKLRDSSWAEKPAYAAGGLLGAQSAQV